MSTHRRRVTKRLAVLLSIVALDAAGVGVIFPVLPGLLRRLVGSADVAILYGAVVALYALAQFVCSPILGALSDRFGRRPVLLASIAGATVDYVFMTFTPSVWGLLAGRAIAGVTGANAAVATSYIADLTDGDRRTRYIGYVNGAYAAGIIIGPVVGGMLGNGGSRLPFLAAAILNGLNLVLTYFTLSESRRAASASTVVRFNPFPGIRRTLTVAPLIPLVAMYGLIELIANLIGTLWLLSGHDRFHWNDATLGASLATLGLFHVVSFAFLAAPLARRLGERRAVVVGIACDSIAMIAIATAGGGWVAFAVAPLFAVGSIGVPVLQASMTRAVGADTQGELQGVLTSIVSLASIIGPLVASGVYAVTARSWSGGAWLVGAALYTLTIPLLQARPASPTTQPQSLERSAA